MARKQAATAESKERHNNITETILHFYLLGYNRKPDSAEYKFGYKIVEALMYPKEDYLRAYTKEEIIYAMQQMHAQGIILKTPKMLYMDHLLSSFVDNDFVLQQYVISKLKYLEDKDGLADPTLIVDVPQGW